MSPSPMVKGKKYIYIYTYVRIKVQVHTNCFKLQIILSICFISISLLTSPNEAMVKKIYNYIYPSLTLNYTLFRKSASSGGDNIN